MKNRMLVYLIVLAALANANESQEILKRIKDPKIDSVYVVCFYPEASLAKEDSNEYDEVIGDFEYQVEQAFTGISNWRVIWSEKKKQKKVWKTLNSTDSLLFVIWHKGKEIMRSNGVAEDQEILDKLNANGISKKLDQEK